MLVLARARRLTRGNRKTIVLVPIKSPTVPLSGRKGNAIDFAYSQTALRISGLFCICAGIEYVNNLASERNFEK